MAFVVSSGELATTGAGVLPAYAPNVLRAAPWEYETIWRTQPQVRTVISFLARNIAQLGIHVFERLSDTDRQRLTDHPLAQLLADPLPKMTTYRFIERLVADYALYDNWYGIKLKLDGRLRILPTPPTLIRPWGGNWIQPEKFETAGGRRFELDEVVHIHGYSPTDLTYGESPIESLRELILESSEAAKQRSAMWRGGARMTGVLVRPADAPEWGTKERARFREMWRTFSQGGGAEGGTPILEDGMDYKAVGFNPEQAEYIEARKLTREEVAAAFHIPPPLVGILDHATYSNIQEQHKILYQDTLGPWLTMLQQEFAAQILADMPGDNSAVYVEFNIAEKMRGSFEEQAAAASTATGGPWMTRNEQRARFNLPAIEGGDELITPLNVTEGGLASPRDTAPEPETVPKAQARQVALKAGQPSQDDDEALRAEFSAALKQVTDDEVARLVESEPDGVDAVRAWWDSGRAERLSRFVKVLEDYMVRFGLAGAQRVLDEFNPSEDGWAAEVMEPWLAVAALHHAQLHDGAGETAAEAAVEDVPEESGVGAALLAAGAVWAAAALARSETAATEAVSFGGHDAAEASGVGFKVWRTTSADPRSQHLVMNGEKVPLGGTFSNGLRWPGDGTGDADQTANCRCILEYEMEE
ncbi:phage portal protein [Streptomyces olivaceus]|uniref:phage portal protein n=1 Tax=Streptomyces olivaceus TaxID=47716 RepID=UPI001CCD6475|nr:phage portal protein [Streptomyces olivaceus]MBZ6258857.1 phage portal protein [Streptomyces olivaceus]